MGSGPNNPPSNATNETIKFTVQCAFSKTYVNIRGHDRLGSKIKFMIENGRKAHMWFTDGSTTAEDCGRWPHRYA
ncbi:MAG: hypothetical protein ACP5QR_12140 [Rhizomicrobium sp.]